MVEMPLVSVRTERTKSRVGNAMLGPGIEFILSKRLWRLDKKLMAHLLARHLWAIHPYRTGHACAKSVRATLDRFSIQIRTNFNRMNKAESTKL